MEAHAHLDDPGSSEWEGGAKAAAAGGITTLIDMPLNSDPSTVSPETLKLKIEAAKKRTHVDVGKHYLLSTLATFVDYREKRAPKSLFVCFWEILEFLQFWQFYQKSGEPREVLSEKGITGTHSLEDRLKTLIDSKKVGSLDELKCGFSSKVVKTLRGEDVSFGSCDILSDE
ncbi:hypothetical protein YC2023_116487 [Brassica napus]